MDPSITSKTTILFDVTTILLSILQQLTFVVIRIRIYMIDHVVLLSLTVIHFLNKFDKR
jgi:hypothetical protein